MSTPLIAVDIGNSRIKLGYFSELRDSSTVLPLDLPVPGHALTLPATDWDAKELLRWSSDVPIKTPWWIASVNRPAATKLTDWIVNRLTASHVRILSHSDIPITAAVEHPERVGIDRLAGAAAANRLRNPAKPAIVIGVGTAITIDLLSADGVFRGGAILPGIGTSAKALEAFTDLLPRSPLEELAGPPPALGTSTLAAIHSGLYWGAIGAMRELIVRLSDSLGESIGKGNDAPRPEIFLTGGAAAAVAKTLDPTARYVEHLVLSGITLAKPQICNVADSK